MLWQEEPSGMGPLEYVDAENLYVTDACIEYLRPLIGELPKYVKLF